MVEPVAGAVSHQAEVVVGGVGPLQDAQGRAVQVGVYHPALAGAADISLIQKGGGGLGGEHPGEVVGDGDAGAHRGAVGLAGEVEQAAVGHAVAVEAGAQRLGAVLAEDADAHGDQAAGQNAGVDVPALQGAGAEVLAQHVGVGGQLPEQLLAPGLAQIEGDRLAAPALDGPKQRVGVVAPVPRGRLVAGVGEGADGAHGIAGAGLFDLDDLGALLAEDAGAERGGDPSAHVEHPQPGQRLTHPGARSSGRWAAYSSRCSAKTSFIDDFCMRRSSAPSAVSVLCIQWWAMKW